MLCDLKEKYICNPFSEPKTLHFYPLILIEDRIAIDLIYKSTRFIQKNKRLHYRRKNWVTRVFILHSEESILFILSSAKILQPPYQRNVKRCFAPAISITQKSVTASSTIDSTLVESSNNLTLNMDLSQITASLMIPHSSTDSSIPTKLTFNFVRTKSSQIYGTEVSFLFLFLVLDQLI